MPRPRRISDEQILEVASTVFFEHGPNVPVSVVAGRLGMSDAAIFKRFGSKEELLLRAILPHDQPAFTEAMAAGPRPGPVRPQLEQILFAMAEILGTIVQRMSLLRAAGIEPAEVLKRYDVPPPVRVHGALAGWLQRAKDAGGLAEHIDPPQLAMVVMGAMHIRGFMAKLVGDRGAITPIPDPSDYAQHLIDTLWSGIAPPEDRA